MLEDLDDLEPEESAEVERARRLRCHLELLLLRHTSLSISRRSPLSLSRSRFVINDADDGDGDDEDDDADDADDADNADDDDDDDDDGTNESTSSSSPKSVFSFGLFLLESFMTSPTFSKFLAFSTAPNAVVAFFLLDFVNSLLPIWRRSCLAAALLIESERYVLYSWSSHNN